ncbi:MAG: AraC family transcriptional regulator [Verrucomicrobiota bacterium]
MQGVNSGFRKQEAGEFVDAFFSHNPSLRAPLEAVAALPGVCVYVKDRESRYVLGNERHRQIYDGLSREEFIGKRSRDFFPALLAEAYEANDRVVFSEGKALRNQVWLVPTIKGTPGWFLSSKTPLTDLDGKIIGLLGMLQPIDTPEDQAVHFGELRQVIDYIESHFVEEITAEGLAELAGLSVPHFNRRFRKLMRLSPLEFVNSLRLAEARRRLATTRQSIGKIASDLGYYDQSYFTKRFRETIGETPLKYRKRFRE